jgi:hypothetical protein
MFERKGYLVFPAIVGICLSLLLFVVGEFASKLFIPANGSGKPSPLFGLVVFLGPLLVLLGGLGCITQAKKQPESSAEADYVTGWTMLVMLFAWIVREVIKILL